MLEIIRTKIKEGLDKTNVDDIIINQTKKVRDAAKQVNKEIRKHIITAITAAFAFMIALFWRDAIQQGVREILDKVGANGDSYVYKIIAALFVTIICVIGIVFVSRFEKKELKKDEKKEDKKA